MTAGEIAIARIIFGDAIDYSTVKIHKRRYLWFGLQPRNVAMAPNGQLYFHASRFQDDFSSGPPGQQHWFMHEMVHVWQWQLGYPVKRRGAVRIGLDYAYVLAPGRTLADYNMEAQGDLLADYFALACLQAPGVMRQRQYADARLLYEQVLREFFDNPSNKASLPRRTIGWPWRWRRNPHSPV